MRNVRKVVLVGGLVLAMAGALVVSPAGAARKGATVQGVTDTEITIAVLQSDLDGLRAAGQRLPAKLTSERLLNTWQMHVDEMGKINGRSVKLVRVQWDPTNATTFDRACTEVVQDVKPFMVLNNAGWRPQQIPCITVEGKLPLMVKDPVQQELFTESGNKLWTLQPESTTMAKANADFVSKHKMVPKSAKIGILASNDPGAMAAADALEARLKKLKYDVVSRVDINALSAATAALNLESAGAVATFTANGVDTVFVGTQTSQTIGFFQEKSRSNADFDVWWVDDAPANCLNSTAQNLPPEAAGTKCLTSISFPPEADGSGVAEDSKFEAECRATNDAKFGEASFPGAPAGDRTINGVTYIGDMEPLSCTMYQSFIYPALKAAGKNLTWNKVATQLEQLTNQPSAGYSGGTVGYGPNKQWAAKEMNLAIFAAPNSATPADANGLFGGCTLPLNCWVTQEVDGKQWFPITTAKG